MIKVLAIVLAFSVGNCNGVREYVDPSPADTAAIAAKVRRAQVIAEIARLNSVLSRLRVVDNRIAIETQLNDRRTELDRLNRIVGD